jgi:hypothetical protein
LDAPLPATRQGHERLPETVAGLHVLSLACIVLARAVKLFAAGS